MKQSVPKSIEEHIAAQSEAVRPKLEQVRAAIRRAVPEAVEGIGYGMPGTIRCLPKEPLLGRENGRR
jgi:uncharacterized protein YdhG (YjbR/CyaY superfamily)